MFNKLYDGFKYYLKRNYKDLIFLILFAFFMLYKLPYYIMVSGGTASVMDRIEIDNSFDSKGSFSMAYITEIRATPVTLLLSYIIPSWESYKISDYQIGENDNIEDILIRNKLDLWESQTAATKVAYDYASKEFIVKNSNIMVYYVYDDVTCDIKTGDQILKVGSYDSIDTTILKDEINKTQVGESITLVLKRNNKELTTSCAIKEEEGEKILGILAYDLLDYDTNPNIEIKFKDNESGPSGGLLLSLAIYDSLVEEDITKGLTIVGTGTINIDGTVGPIGGVSHKFKASVKGKADVFIVPNGENYEEVMKIKKDKNYDIVVLGVDSFEDAINKLNALEK